MRLLITLVSLVIFVLPAYAGSIAETAAKLNFTEEQLFAIGEKIYNTEGSNTCLKCHGKGGHGGDQAGAADLRHPRTWRSYQALGGDKVFEADKEKFRNDLETALYYLIRNGAINWNMRFGKTHKDIKYDWSQVTVPNKANKYNNMMKGLTSGPLKKQVKAIKKELKLKKTSEARSVSAVAAFTYVKSLDDGSDKGGVFTDPSEAVSASSSADQK